jgi:flavin-dependent dehydrogenase
MECDVVVVGAGPAGLATAIRLKQLAAAAGSELSVIVLEKGSEVGAHIVSGAVIDPIGLNKLIPDWKAKGAPVDTPVTEDRFYYLGPSGALRIPNFVMPPLMSNHGNYVVSLGNLVRWLGEQAAELGVDIYPEFAASEVLYDEKGAVAGVATGDKGVGKDGKPTVRFQRGIELKAKYTVIAEGARGSLAKMLTARFGLDKGRQPQKFGLGLKELWEVRPEAHRAGLVQHTLGWPLSNRTGGGSFLYHYGANLVSVGFVVYLNYDNPYLSPYQEFQRFKTHPAIRDTFEGGKRIAYGARALTEGGWQSIPQLAFPGGVLVGCAAGFMNVPRIKGSHNAMLSGIHAAEAAFAAIGAGARTTGRCHPGGQRPHRPRPGACATPAPICQVRHRARHRRSRRRHVGQYADSGHRLHLYAQAQEARPRHAEDIGSCAAHRLPESRQHPDLRPADQCLLLRHQPRGGPAGAPQGRRHAAAARVRARRVRGPFRALLPGRRLRVGGGGRRAALRHHARTSTARCVRHQRTPTRTSTGVEGGGGPNHPGDVNAGRLRWQGRRQNVH